MYLRKNILLKHNKSINSATNKATSKRNFYFSRHSNNVGNLNSIFFFVIQNTMRDQKMYRVPIILDPYSYSNIFKYHETELYYPVSIFGVLPVMLNELMPL